MLQKKLFIFCVGLITSVLFFSDAHALQAVAYNGSVLLNLDKRGENWYVEKATGRRMKLPSFAKDKILMLRQIARPVSPKELSAIPLYGSRKKINKSTCAKLKGEWMRLYNSKLIWYVDPIKCQRVYFDGTSTRWQYIINHFVVRLNERELTTIPEVVNVSDTPAIIESPVMRGTPSAIQPPLQSSIPVQIVSDKTNSLIRYPFVSESDAGSLQTVKLVVGQTFDLTDTVRLRLDKLDASSEHITLWNKDRNGCRFIYDWVSSYKNGDDEQRYKTFSRWFFRLDDVRKDSLVLSIYRGDAAHDVCLASPVQKVRCTAYWPSGSYTIFSENFSRNYLSQNEYAFNNLMLNYQERSLEKLKKLFPSLIVSRAPIDRWRFSSHTSSSLDERTDSTWLDSAYISSWMPVDPQSQDAAVGVYNEKLLRNDLNFDLSTDTHEWTHMLLASSELGVIPSLNGESNLLMEGVADYISNVAKYYPNRRSVKQSICGESGFINTGTVLNGMTYTEAFRHGYTYDAGNCFFTRLEEICGFRTIDALLQRLLRHPYERALEYPSLFSILQSNCSRVDRFPQLMEDFGFSTSLLNRIYTLSSYTPLDDEACR